MNTKSNYTSRPHLRSVILPSIGRTVRPAARRRISIHRAWLLLAMIVAAAGPLGADDGLPRAKPEDAGMSSQRLLRIGAVMEGYINRNELSGTVTLVARRGKVVHL